MRIKLRLLAQKAIFATVYILEVKIGFDRQNTNMIYLHHNLCAHICVLTLGLKRITDPKQTAILKAERKMKKRVLEKAVEYIREHPQKPKKPSKPSLLPLHGINATQDKGSPPTSPGLSVTSPARKMMPPVKNYLSSQSQTAVSNTWKYSAIPPAKTVSPSTNHMLVRKRSYSDGSGIQQNGIDGKDLIYNYYLDSITVNNC